MVQVAFKGKILCEKARHKYGPFLYVPLAAQPRRFRLQFYNDRLNWNHEWNLVGPNQVDPHPVRIV